MLREQHAADRIGRHLLDASANLAALLEVGIFADRLLDHLKRFRRGADHQSLRADAASEVAAPGGVPAVQTSEREDESLLALSEADQTYGRDALHAARAAILYDEIDRNKLFKGTAVEEDRSLMNVCFVMNDEYKELEADFNAFASAAGMVGIKGHRSVGGFRASLYNAMPKSSVEALVACMKEFEKQH